MRALVRTVAMAVAVGCLLTSGSAVARADERPSPGVRSVKTLYSSEVTVTVIVDRVWRNSQVSWIERVVGRSFGKLAANGLGSERYNRSTGRLKILWRWNGHYTNAVDTQVRYLNRTRPWYKISADDKTVTKVDITVPVKKFSDAGLARLEKGLPKIKGAELFVGWGQRDPAMYSLTLVARRKLSQKNLNDVAAAIQRAVGTKPSRLKFALRADVIG